MCNSILNVCVINIGTQNKQRENSRENTLKSLGNNVKYLGNALAKK